ncbi:hypothetical protein FRC00_006977 [Tulasnella sp. 408]|nr:hypothetical protein FRC00_006977 [Tulasnella sp. 408]
MAAPNESCPLLPPPAKSGITLDAKTVAPVHIGTVGGYVASAVVAVWLSSPAGLSDRFLTAFFTIFGSIDRDRMLASSALLYAFTTYVFTSANSIVGVGLGSAGYHHDVFALVAGLTAAQGPSNALYHQGVTLLALHVFCKAVIFVPAYIKGLGVLRSAAHFIAIGALLGSLYQMTFSAQ